MNKTFYLALTAATVMACSCAPTDSATLSGLNPQAFRTTVDGRQTQLYTLTNGNGMEVCLTNYGGRIVSVVVPDRDGVMRDVVLGFDSIGGYLNHKTDMGASIGRYANRIANGRFTLDSVEYQLPQNNFGHCLHGGTKGFQYVVYNAQQTADTSIVMSYTSADGEMGFPGELTCKVTFALTSDNAIDISYEATATRPTIVNMTNHSYFNLSGNPLLTNSNHLLTVNADSITPVDSTFMTTGEMMSVEGTPFDFRQPAAIGQRIDQDNEQLRYGKGIDHNFVLNTRGSLDQTAAQLTSPETGITLSVFTTEPGIQVYCGNFLDGSCVGKYSIAYPRRASVCLETQHYPDSPNKPHWPATVLRPGQTYNSRCIYKFSINK